MQTIVLRHLPSNKYTCFREKDLKTGNNENVCFVVN